jgi:hypothetical protein
MASRDQNTALRADGMVLRKVSQCDVVAQKRKEGLLFEESLILSAALGQTATHSHMGFHNAINFVLDGWASSV